MSDVDAWEEMQTEMSGITTQELDNAVIKMVEAKKDYEAKDKVKKEAYAVLGEAKKNLEELLVKAGKSKYVTDLGTISLVRKSSFRIPKSYEDKKAMIEYFQSLGDEVYYNKVSVNSQTLNSYINQELDNNPDFVMPGCNERKDNQEIRFKKK